MTSKIALATLMFVSVLAINSKAVNLSGDCEQVRSVIQTCSEEVHNPNSGVVWYHNGPWTYLTDGGQQTDYLAACGAPPKPFPPTGAGYNRQCFLHFSKKGLAGKVSRSAEHPYNQCNSIIGTDTQTLGENIPIVGTDFNLAYSSERMIGRTADYTLRLEVPTSQNLNGVTSIKVKSTIAGRETTYDLPAVSGQVITIPWDGNNSSGTATLGSAAVQLVVSENGAEDYPISFQTTVGQLKAKALGFGGWTPSIYHFYDSTSSTLYRGDGTTRQVKATSTVDGYWLSETNGGLVYYFDLAGRHLKTVTGITGRAIYTFNHQNQILANIVDGFGKVTVFKRDAIGKLTGIQAANGKVTSVAIDTNGYLASVTSPNGDVFTLTSGSKGLLKTFQKPVVQISNFS